MRKRARIAMAVLLLAASTSACRGPGSWFGVKKQPTSNKMVVAASFYPIAEIVQRVAGDAVDVLNLTPAGTDAHDVELTAKQLQQLQDAKITFYLANLTADGRVSTHFQPTIEKALSTYKGQKVDLMNDLPVMVPLCGGCKLSADPHVWLDPKFMILMTKTVQLTLSKARPDLATNLSTNATEFISELMKVGDAIDSTFKKCSSNVLVTSHRSFYYFASRAKLELHPLTGVNPEAQLSAKEIETAVNGVTHRGVATVFSEEMVSNQATNTVAEALNASIDTLHPLEGMTESDLKLGKNYITVQNDNIARIAKGLRCS